MGDGPRAWRSFLGVELVMLLYFSIIILALNLLAGQAYAASTANPTLPQSGLPYQSSPIRNNFQALINDVDALQTCNAAATAPSAPTTGYCWLDTSGGNGSWVYRIYDGITSTWVGLCTISGSGGTGTCGSNAAFSVANNAGLSSLSTGATSAALRLGFATAGDAPAMTYIPGSTPCSLNGGNGDGGSQVPSANGKCWVAQLPSAGVSPVEWGAVGNGSADDTAAVQTAINSASTLGVPLVFDNVHLYKISGTLNIVSPIDIEGPYRHGLYTTVTAGGTRSCSWGLLTSANVTLLNITAVTATVNGLCMQLGASTGAGVSATAGAAVALAPPSTTAYQTGVTITHNTILNPYDGITINGAGYSVGCCGEGSTANGNFIGWNTIVNPADVGIANGKNTAGGETVGNTIWDNTIGCANAISKASGIGVALYDGAIDYDGTENGPEGCNMGVAVIPGTVSGVGQNAQLLARGVLGDQGTTYGLAIVPSTASGIISFSEVYDGWAAGVGASGTPVLISNVNGGIIEGVKLLGGFYHSGAGATGPIVDIEGNASGAGAMGLISINDAHIDCWGGSSCSGAGLKVNGSGAGQPAHLVITGNHIGENDEAGGGSTLATGILISGGGVAYATITGNDLTEPTTPISFTPPAATDRILFSANAGVDDLCPAYASAGTVNINNADSCMTVTGTTTVTTLGNPWANRSVKIVATSGFSFATGGNICTNLSLASGRAITAIWQAGATCWSLD